MSQKNTSFSEIQWIKKSYALNNLLSQSSYSLIFGVMSLCFLCTVSYAKYPEKPIRLVVGYPPGGANDLIARQVASKLTQLLSIQVVVDNRPGANGIISCELVMKASPDGYTLLFAGLTPLVSNSLTYSKLPYATMTDFSGISMVASGPLAIAVRPDLLTKDVKDLIHIAKTRPGKLNFATIGTGGFTRVFFELFKSVAKIDVHFVPYKGGVLAITDVIGGQVDAIALDLAPLLPIIKNGMLNGIAITSKTRNPEIPNIRTMSEQGMPEMTSGNWYAILAPKKLPLSIANTLNKAIVTGINAVDFKDKLLSIGVDPMASASSQALESFMNAELVRWGAVVKSSNIKSE